MSISLILTKLSILHQATNLSRTNRVCLFVFYLNNSSPMSTHKSNVSKRWLVLLLTIDWMVLSYGKEVSNYGKNRSQLLRLSIEQNRSVHPFLFSIVAMHCFFVENSMLNFTGRLYPWSVTRALTRIIQM